MKCPLSNKQAKERAIDILRRRADRIGSTIPDCSIVVSQNDITPRESHRIDWLETREGVAHCMTRFVRWTY